jgi:hypothetical protein
MKKMLIVFYDSRVGIHQHFLIEQPMELELDVLDRYHAVVTDCYDWEDDDEYDAIINAANNLIESWEKYAVGEGDNMAPINDVDQVRFYGVND